MTNLYTRIEALLTTSPQLSNRAVAKQLGTNPMKVWRVRQRVAGEQTTNQDKLITAIAYHEAGHAVATMLAFHAVQHRYPLPMPALPVKFVKLEEETLGRWSGLCYGPEIYSTIWPDQRIDHQWREAMEWQIVINFAGGIAEAIHRGEKRKRDLLWFVAFNCGTDGDLKHADEVLADLRKLTGRRYGEQRFAERTLDLLMANWAAVAAVAAALADKHWIDGDELEEILRGRS